MIKNCVEVLLREGKTIPDIAEELQISKSWVMRVKRDAGIVNGTEKTVVHHVKYKEIHGVDETVLLTLSEHNKLHHRLRKSGKCTVPVKELSKISCAANERTCKRKNSKKMYNNSCVKNIQRICFVETPGPHVQLREQISYNKKNGKGYYSAWFSGNHGIKLPVIEVAT